MYLMDEICQCAARIVKNRQNRDPVLAVYLEFAERLKLAPRYLLDDATSRAACELVFGRPKVLLDAISHVTIGYPALWVEWPEAGREVLRQRLGNAYEHDPGRPIPDRVGFLIETEEGGRSGLVTWCWNDTSGAWPNIAPIGCYFDLDQRVKQAPVLLNALKRNKLHNMWLEDPVQEEAFLEIWRTSRHLPTPAGERYLHDLARNGAPLQSILEQVYCDVYGEYLNYWGVMLLLTASRPTVEYKEVDRSRLNKARSKRKETALLDHTQVTMHISHHSVSQQQRQPLGYQRKSPRIHVVSSYLATRNGRHFIVQPYLRGSGEPVTRHVHVRQ